MQEKKLFGRAAEKKILEEYYNSKSSSMIAVIGRRRIGKTYLVRQTLKQNIDFELVGIQNGNTQDQLLNFQYTLHKYVQNKTSLPTPKNWIEAFYQLQTYLVNKRKNKKKVIFFDEFPWINSAKSGFVEKFAHFWNSWASENNVMIVLCGSAATWMLKHVVNGKGGLHNRISQTLVLEPFKLQQTKEMLLGLGIKPTAAQLIEIYMVFGGVPYYLSLLQKAKSIYQNIDALLFTPNGKLYKEFNNLLPSLFDNATNHIEVVNALASKWKGLTRNELTQIYNKADGGGLTQILLDLEQSGFVTSYIPFRKSKKDTLYRLSDSYLLFYLKFLRRHKQSSFLDVTKSSNYRIWCGYAFENLCLQHIEPIKAELGIAKINTNVASFVYKGNAYQDGFQIDMLIERADGVINICEMKFHNTTYTIDKKQYKQIKHTLATFQEIVGRKQSLYYTLITLNGASHNEYYYELVDNDIESTTLF